MANENIVNKVEQPVLVPKTELLPDASVEKNREVVAEKIAVEKNIEKAGVVTTKNNEVIIPTTTAPVITDSYHARREKEIENYLSEGLSETFLAMPPQEQKIFKEEGELTAKKINVLLDATKVSISKIVKLIRHWLRLITSINRFFLDQEAKLKADKIIKIKNKL